VKNRSIDIIDMPRLRALLGNVERPDVLGSDQCQRLNRLEMSC
jgi:hypothetical protein